mgnify:CR=1 FL=1
MIAKRLSGAQSAMMREIAAQAGNFRGVCPTIGRLKDLNTAYIAVNGGNRPALMPVSFMSRSDTHESVDKSLLPYGGRARQTQLRMRM